ncbi:HD domain-containing protein [Seleniivibrio sp.]|uniref:HD domain-containing protein n=1 Tax=Seleniivibrio sp. TaxID=2898801 RepID=UPI0025F83619|nr:HD domain-containing protein [Seleniivibrio sp.]MCD8554885.1 HD domain-containing protein [Seleniivibrio sp.]
MKEISDRSATFFYELGILQTMKRSGQDYLGSGTQSIADHIFRTAMIGFTMAKMVPCDADKVLKMCMFHDLEESRTGDLNYLQQNYVNSDDEKALNHVVKGLPIEEEVSTCIDEYAAQQSLEALIAKDADTLELIFFLKEQLDKGNKQAENWIKASSQRLKTDIGKEIMQSCLERMYYEWWYSKDENWRRGSKNW